MRDSKVTDSLIISAKVNIVNIGED